MLICSGLCMIVGFNWHLIYPLRAKVEWLDPQETEETLEDQ